MRFDGMHNLPTPQCLANVGDEPGQVGFVICTTDDLKLRVEDCRVALRKELDHGFALGEHFRVTKDGRLQLSLTTRELQQSAVPEIGRAPCRERVGQSVSITVVASHYKKKHNQKNIKK